MRVYQNILNDILKAFAQFCKENNLSFFLIAGTLLGAVRHKGIIPWDDDIDVGMLRKDYEKLIEICRSHQPEGYFLQEGRTYNKYWQIFAKFRKNNTCKFEDKPLRFYPKEHRGINIDIFPFDFISSSDTIRKIQFFFLQQIRHIIALKRGYKIKGMLFMFIPRKLLAIILPFKFFHWLARVIMTFNKDKSKYCISWGGIYGYKKEMHLFTDIFPLSELEFEGERYCVPFNWDTYLKNMYGNYMELPPVEVRETKPPRYSLSENIK